MVMMSSSDEEEIPLFLKRLNLVQHKSTVKKSALEDLRSWIAAEESGIGQISRAQSPVKLAAVAAPVGKNEGTRLNSNQPPAKSTTTPALGSSTPATPRQTSHNTLTASSPSKSRSILTPSVPKVITQLSQSFLTPVIKPHLNSPLTVTKSLAEELFPTPPSSVVIPIDARRRSPSIISDSEPDLPSLTSPRLVSSEIKRSGKIRVKTPRKSFLVPDSEDESSESDVAPRRMPQGKKKARTSTSYSLQTESDSDLDSTCLKLDSLNLANDTPRQKSRSNRRITISVVETDSDSSFSSPSSSSDSDYTTDDSSSRMNRNTPSSRVLGKRTGKEKMRMNIDYSDEEDEEDLRVVSLPSGSRSGSIPQRNRSPLPESNGVLTYEPTPRARPRALPTSMQKPNAIVSSPSLVRDVLKKNLLPSKRSVAIDLTGSSEEDEAEIRIPPPKFKKVAPAGSTSSRPSTPRQKPRLAVATPSKPARLTIASRETISLAIVRELDRAVFRKRWEGMKCLDGKDGEGMGIGLPDGLQLVWNNRLRNTAGRASWKSKKLNGVTTQTTTIELSTKVLDTAEKLRQTLAHELVHVAAWTLSNELKPPHGDAFKLWGARVMKVFPGDIKVTTCHSYEIAYKYRWRCNESHCGMIFSRHSKSIDPSTHGCKCGGKLQQIDTNDQVILPRTPAKKTAWDEFRSMKSAEVRRDQPGIKLTDVAKIVGAMWSEAKLAKAGSSSLVDEMARMRV